MKTIPTLAMMAATALIAFAFAIWALFPPDSNSGTAPLTANIAQGSLQTQDFAIVGQDHIRQGGSVTYNSNPPTSGEHFASALPWGVYRQKVFDESAVHNIEHGGIWIAYNPELDRGSVRLLRKITKRYPNAVVMSPRPDNDSAVTIVSWGRLMKLDAVDADTVDAYIRLFINNSPEPSASLDSRSVRVSKKTVELVNGRAFPRFNLIDVDGSEASSDTLAGKTSLVWFTSSWCVPCQIGAKRVAKLDTELGGNAFDVIVVFVDPNEDDDDLHEWKDKFANPDWQVAFDSQLDPLSKKIGLRFLDSKYLLDANGILLNQNFQIANDDYLDLINRLAGES